MQAGMAGSTVSDAIAALKDAGIAGPLDDEATTSAQGRPRRQNSRHGLGRDHMAAPTQGRSVQHRRDQRISLTSMTSAASGSATQAETASAIQEWTRSGDRPPVPAPMSGIATTQHPSSHAKSVALRVLVTTEYSLARQVACKLATWMSWRGRRPPSVTTDSPTSSSPWRAS